jgi:hypothetical protein
VPNLADRGRRVVSATDPHGHNLGFLDPELYYLKQFVGIGCFNLFKTL